MELNRLLHAHQAAVMNASEATDDRVRDGHFATVARYADKIRDLRDARRRTKRVISGSRAPTVIYGTYAGDTTKRHRTAGIAVWESEGGALDPVVIPPPRATPLRLAPQYFVGSCIYTDLAAAVAAHQRQKAAH